MSAIPLEDVTLGETNDLASLARLDEQILLSELKERYGKHNIYVSITEIISKISYITFLIFVIY